MVNARDREASVLQCRHRQQRVIDVSAHMKQDELDELAHDGWRLNRIDECTSKRGNRYYSYVFVWMGEPVVEHRGQAS